MNEDPSHRQLKQFDRAKWDSAVAALQKMAEENLKGDPWENMSSEEIIDDLRGGPLEPSEKLLEPDGLDTSG